MGETRGLEARLFPAYWELIASIALRSIEGQEYLAEHLHRERDRTLARKKKKAVLAKSGKLECEVCSFDFASTFYPYAGDFCEVHHRNPIAASDGKTPTRLEDFAIVCSNSHSVLHLIRPVPSIDALRSFLTSPKTTRNFR